jgi:hypothetical protein
VERRYPSLDVIYARLACVIPACHVGLLVVSRWALSVACGLVLFTLLADPSQVLSSSPALLLCPIVRRCCNGFVLSYFILCMTCILLPSSCWCGRHLMCICVERLPLGIIYARIARLADGFCGCSRHTRLLFINFIHLLYEVVLYFPLHFAHKDPR